MELALTDFISADGTLPCALESLNFCHSQLQMLITYARVNPLAPHIKAAPLQTAPHQRNYLRFIQIKLNVNRFKRCAVFPCHLYYSIYIDR